MKNGSPAFSRTGLKAKHPDDFISGLFEFQPGAVLAAVRGHRAALKSPPRSSEEHLRALEGLGLTRTVSALSHLSLRGFDLGVCRTDVREKGYGQVER